MQTSRIMKPKLAKVHRIPARGKATHNHPARVVSERQATNFELLRDSVQARGHVRLRTVIQIQCADGGYAGARGNSLRFLAPSVKAAEMFFRDVAETLPQVAQAAGLVLLTAKPKKEEAVTA